jgi:hypothetical protein
MPGMHIVRIGHLSRPAAARLGLAAITTATLLLGIGTVGRKAWFEHSTPAVATMTVMLGLFAVAAVIWGRSLPVPNATLQTAEFVVTGLPPANLAELTTRMAAVGAVWPGGDLAAGWPVADEADALNAFVTGDGALITAGEVTEPLLFTHEFSPAAMMAVVDEALQMRQPGHGPTLSAINAARAALELSPLTEHTPHVGGSDSVHVLDLLRREGFDGGVA